MSFVSYLNHQRIMKAKELLLDSDMKIEEIGKEVGFSQTSYFCKTFKKIMSVSPVYYRKNHQKINFETVRNA